MQIRNIAIIAHVDHGKTTLVDQLLRQAGIFRENQEVQERVMDSNPLERERGITILSKNTALHWGDVKINIVDTPGHADFGGEVERILRMVDGVLILVDAAEGPMPQTRFVTRKALELGLMPVVVINKVDRADARPLEVHDEVLELFMELEASDAQLDAPFLYGAGRQGWVSREPETEGSDLTPLFQTIVDAVPAPATEVEGPFQMLVSTLDYSTYVGRIAIGRIERGRVRVGDRVALLPYGEPGPVGGNGGGGETAEGGGARPEGAAKAGANGSAEDGDEEGASVHEARVVQLYTFQGLDRVDVQEARAGDIVALAGLEGVEIGKTLTDPAHKVRLRGIAVEEPTISVDFSVNDSPFSGRSGKYVTSRQLRERLYRELQRNVALRVQDTERPDAFTVSGRGELHLTILMETMRREGYEFQVSRPRVIRKEDEAGRTLEPYEEAVVEVPPEMVGVVIEKLGARKGEMVEMRNTDRGPTRIRFRIPARGLFGYRSEFLTDTRGEGTLHHNFLEYGPWVGELTGRNRGAIVADREGEAVAYAIYNLQDRGTFFVSPGARVYSGMIVGEHIRPGDLEVNICREKKLTNIRAAASDENIRLEPAREITLEMGLEFIEPDELMEVTPDRIRLRKRLLDPNARKKAARKTAAAAS